MMVFSAEFIISSVPILANACHSVMFMMTALSEPQGKLMCPNIFLSKLGHSINCWQDFIIRYSGWDRVAQQIKDIDLSMCYGGTKWSISYLCILYIGLLTKSQSMRYTGSETVGAQQLINLIDLVDYMEKPS